MRPISEWGKPLKPALQKANLHQYDVKPKGWKKPKIPDAPVILPSGETVAEALCRLRLNGITQQDVFWAARQIFWQEDKNTRVWTATVHQVLIEWNPDKYPWPEEQPKGKKRTKAMEQALKEADELTKNKGISL